MIIIETQPEWLETAVAATNTWPTQHLDDLVSWLWSRNEPALRILASVIERRPEMPS